MSTTQSPQDEIAAMQATLARHDEDLERIKQRMLESEESTRALLESIVTELAATRDNIAQELRAVNERLDAHTRILNSHTERLDAHTSMLNSHTERLDAQTAAQANTAREIAGINGEISTIKETLSVLVDRTDAMSRTLNETNSRVGNLTGTRYERRVARIILRRPSRTIGLSQPQMLHTDWGETDAAFLDLLSDADTITDDEYEDLLASDIILAGQNAAGQNAYAVIEISVTVGSTDVNRAARRARTLTGAVGTECTAVVVGSEIPDAERERATGAGVAVIVVAEPED